jgi:hypothetical protein
VTNVAYAEPFRTGLPVADDEREPAGRVPATRPAHLPARRPSVTTQSMIGEKLSDDGSINDKDNVYSWPIGNQRESRSAEHYHLRWLLRLASASAPLELESILDLAIGNPGPTPSP